MRQVYLDTITKDNEIYKLSFYSPSEGYVAFKNWIGYTTDSGRTYSKKIISSSNVNYGSYNINPAIVFDIKGVKAINKSIIIAYGDYFFVPAILYSKDGGNSFTLVLCSRADPNQTIYDGITDMVFPQNGNIGYAIDANRILKTTDQGLNWSTARVGTYNYFDYLESVDDNTVIAISTSNLNNNNPTNRAYKTINGGSSWQAVTFPITPTGFGYVHFLSANIGWSSLYDIDYNTYFYKTTNGGTSWVLQNDIVATPFYCSQMKFIDNNIGYARAGQNTIYKTFNSGITWEPLPRDNNYAYLGFSHNDMQCISANQLWAGGDHSFLELSANGGGTPIPKAYFKIDTVGVSTAGNVNLLNYSLNANYTFKWYLNGMQISTAYNANYMHDKYRSADTVTLIVSNILNTNKDTAMKIQYFKAEISNIPSITSFLPTTGQTGTVVTITGVNFIGTTAVTFGGVPATDFSVVSSTKIIATVGIGATGDVLVTTTVATVTKPTFTFFTRLTIFSFSPFFGQVGTIVTINGTNFSTIPTDNIVCFGSIRANVISASTTQLQVSAPVGSPYLPISVSVNGLTAFTNLSFVLTFPGGCSFNSTSFNPKLDFDAGSPESSIAADFDGDGLPDIISVNSDSYYNKYLSMLRNTSTLNNILFAAKQSIPLDPNTSNNSFGVGDINGDGKPDIFAPISTGFATYINTSKKASISFDSPKGFNDNYGRSKNYNLADFDGDGKPDLYCQSLTSSALVVYKNTSNNNNITFRRDALLYPIGMVGSKVVDIDNDGKPDIVTCVNDNGVFLIVYKNTSVNDSITFSELSRILISNNGYIVNKIEVGDVDGDGKADVVVSQYPAVSSSNSTISNISILRNTSITGTISFASNVDLPLNLSISDCVLSDLDGDGKIDVVATAQYNDSPFLIFINKSNPSAIQFAPKVDCGSLPYVYSGRILAADFDLDGKPDILNFGNARNANIEIFKNNLCNSQTIQICANGDTILSSNITGSTYQWQQNTGSGFINIVDNANFSGASIVKLRLSKIPIAWNTYQYRCVVNGNNFSTAFNLYVTNATAPNISIITPTTNICAGSPITFTATPTNGGTVPAYQWQVNGVNAGTNNSTFTSSSLNNNDQVKVILTSNSNCASTQTATSNIITVTVVSNVTPSVSISTANTSVCSGMSVSFTATPINGGTSPTYQWQVNGVNVGTNNPAFTSSSLSNGSQIKVVMTTSANCVQNQTATSNIISITVNNAAVPTVSITASSTKICIGDSVTFIATPINGGTLPNFQWQVNGINIGTNSPTFTTTSLTNGSQVKVVLTSSALCTLNQTATSNTIAISINNGNAPTVSISSTLTSICIGDSITFAAIPLNGGLVPTYQWQINGVNAGSNTPTYTTSSLTNGNQVKVLFTNSGSCGLPTTVSSNSISVTVNNTVIPAVSITTPSTNICIGNNVTFTAIPINGGSSTNYQWLVDNVIVGGNSSILVTNKLTNGSLVKTIMTSNAACAISAAVTSNIIKLSVNLINPSMSISGKTTLKIGSSTIISSALFNIGAGSTFQWQDSTQTHPWMNIVGAINSTTSYILASNGDKLRCVLTSISSCTINNTVLSNVLTFIGNGTLNYYPNPVHNILTIDGVSLLDKWQTLEIRSIDGRQSIMLNNITGQTKILVDVSALSGGYYFAILRREQGTPLYLKFIKQ